MYSNSTSLLSLVCNAAFLCLPLMAQADRPSAHHYFSKTAHEPVAKWGYSGSTGPEFWGQLDPSYQLARSGKQQSPINLDTKKVALTNLPALKFEYRPEKIAAINNGHTIQHNEDPGSFLYVGDTKYALEQFHLHSPSEHTIDGRPYDIEIHFVHKSSSGQVAVVGVLVEGDENAILDFPIYADLPNKENEIVVSDVSKNASEYLPVNRAYFTYAGSFTTPPCTEQVKWIVMQQPIGAHPKYIERLAAILKANSRPIQGLNDRVVEKSK